MKQFKKGDLEYRSNGYYVVEGIDYMSIWTYKIKHNILSNSKELNGQDAIELSSICSSIISTFPDFGGYDNIYAYPVKELETFYN